MSVKLLTAHYLEFKSLKGGCTGSSESTLVKMLHCWKSHDAAKVLFSVEHIMEKYTTSDEYLAKLTIPDKLSCFRQ